MTIGRPFFIHFHVYNGKGHESPDKRCLFNKRRNIRNSPYNYFTKRLFIKQRDVVGAVPYVFIVMLSEAVRRSRNIKAQAAYIIFVKRKAPPLGGAVAEKRLKGTFRLRLILRLTLRMIKKDLTPFIKNAGDQWSPLQLKHTI